MLVEAREESPDLLIRAWTMDDDRQGQEDTKMKAGSPRIAFSRSVMLLFDRSVVMQQASAMFMLIFFVMGCGRKDASAGPETTLGHLDYLLQAGSPLDLPSEEEVLFDVWFFPEDDFADRISEEDLPIGGQAGLDLAPGTYEINADYEWRDPSVEDPDTECTGGYHMTVCSDAETFTIQTRRTTSVTLIITCSQEWTD